VSVHVGIAQLLGSVIDGLSYSESGPEGNVFVDHLPSEPTRAVGVYAQPGPEADSKLPYDPAQFQVVVRSETGGAWALATWEAIYSELHGKRYVSLPDGTELVYCLSQQSSPFRFGDDDQGRPRLSANYRTEIINATKERQ